MADKKSEVMEIIKGMTVVELAELVKALETEFGLGRDRMIDQGALKAISLEVFERTFAVTGALNVLTLGVAAVALLIGGFAVARYAL